MSNGSSNEADDALTNANSLKPKEGSKYDNDGVSNGSSNEDVPALSTKLVLNKGGVRFAGKVEMGSLMMF